MTEKMLANLDRLDFLSKQGGYSLALFDLYAVLGGMIQEEVACGHHIYNDSVLFERELCRQMELMHQVREQSGYNFPKS